VEVGGTMDTLNDGQWNFTGNGKYRAEFAVKGADGKLAPIAAFEGDGTLRLAADADTRYSGKLRTQEQVLYDLMAEVKKEPLRGRLPKETLLYAHTFAPGLSPKYDRAVEEFSHAVRPTGYIPQNRFVHRRPQRAYCQARGVLQQSRTARATDSLCQSRR
jgi:hypothetical protein